MDQWDSHQEDHKWRQGRPRFRPRERRGTKTPETPPLRVLPKLTMVSRGQ